MHCASALVTDVVYDQLPSVFLSVAVYFSVRLFNVSVSQFRQNGSCRHKTRRCPAVRSSFIYLTARKPARSNKTFIGPAIIIAVLAVCVLVVAFSAARTPGYGTCPGNVLCSLTLCFNSVGLTSNRQSYPQHLQMLDLYTS